LHLHALVATPEAAAPASATTTLAASQPDVRAIGARARQTFLADVPGGPFHAFFQFHEVAAQFISRLAAPIRVDGKLASFPARISAPASFSAVEHD
jgi:hypothetical protein